MIGEKFNYISVEKVDDKFDVYLKGHLVAHNVTENQARQLRRELRINPNLAASLDELYAERVL